MGTQDELIFAPFITLVFLQPTYRNCLSQLISVTNSHMNEITTITSLALLVRHREIKMPSDDQTALSSTQISKYRERLMQLDTVILDTSLLISEKAPADRQAHQHVLMAKELQRHFTYAPAPLNHLSALNTLNSITAVLSLALAIAGMPDLPVLSDLIGD
jgi:hypothetical protein